MADHQRQGLAVVVGEAAPEALDAWDVLEDCPEQPRVCTISTGQEPVPGPLEHDEPLRLLGDLGHELNGARTGPDHGDTLAAKVVVAIPPSGMEAPAREVVLARDPGNRRLVQLPGSDHDRVGVPRAAVGTSDRPSAELV